LKRQGTNTARDWADNRPEGRKSMELLEQGTNQRRIGKLSAFVLAIAMMTLALAGASAQSASADQNVNFKLDTGVIKMSDTWAKIVDPSLDPPDNPATLAANVAEDGTLTAAKEDFTFPVKRITNLATGNSLLPMVDAKIEIAAADNITGNLDMDSGVVSLNLPAEAVITVYPAGSPASVARCKVSGMTFAFATSGQLQDPGDPSASPPRPAHDYDAAAFAPPSGAGAMLATWASLPNSEILGGSLASIVCPAVDGLIGGPGGLWLEGTALPGEKPGPDVPTVAPNITANPASSTDQVTATFSFEKGDGETQPVDGFECSLDSGTPEPCNSGTKEYANLTVGEHSFSVKATNSAGSGPAASYSWTITGTSKCPDGTTGTYPDCVKPKAKLGTLKVQPKKKTVKRGKKAVVKVKVKNAGNAAATGVKVCVKAPKKLVKVKKCVSLGQVAAGKSKTAKFKVKAKRKKGQAVLKFTATSNNAGKKAGKAKVRIK